jgi:hypothetical protein
MNKVLLLIIAMALIILLAVGILVYVNKSIRGYYFPKYKITETKTFSEIPGFSFDYPVFKGWKVSEIKKYSEDEYRIFLNNPSQVKFEIAPQIIIKKQNAQASIELESAVMQKNKNNIYYSYYEDAKNGNHIIFYGDFIKVSIYPFMHEGDGYSSKEFIKEVIETFNEQRFEQ